MSQKFKLVQDAEEDSPWASIKRHLRLASLLIVVPLVALLALTMVSFSAEARQRSINENTRTAIAMTRTAQPTKTPLPMPLSPTISHQTLLRRGPGRQFSAVRTMNLGEPVILVNRDATGQWYMLNNGFWIAADAVIGKDR